MGDIVKVVKFNGKCPVYEFQAVVKTVDDLGLHLTDYTAVQVSTGKTQLTVSYL